MTVARRGAVVVTVLIAAALLLAGCAAGPLDPSEPEEVVLRSARLAGFEGTAAGRDGDAAFAWLDLPGVDSAADVEIAWQTGFASLATVYPRADAYRVRVSVSGSPVLEIEASGSDVRAAVEEDDADALRAAAAFAYLAPDVSVEPPSEALVSGIDATEAYLDAKNRAAGLLGEDGGPAALKFARLSAEVQRMRAAVPGKAAPPPGGAAEEYARTILGSLDGAAAGEEAVRARIDAIAGSSTEDVTAQVADLRTLSAVVEAVVGPRAYGSLLEPAAELAAAVKESDLAAGAASDAVLAAAGDDAAPVSARDVASFERELDSDISSERTGDTLVAQALVAGEGAWTGGDGTPQRLADQDWLAYRRADSALFWLGSVDGDLALTDRSVSGWALARLEVAVVNASDVGELLGVIEVPGLLAQGGD